MVRVLYTGLKKYALVKRRGLLKEGRILGGCLRKLIIIGRSLKRLGGTGVRKIS